jgi:hypothetical protein
MTTTPARHRADITTPSLIDGRPKRPLGWILAACEGDGPHIGRPEYIHGQILCPACAEESSWTS